MGARSGSVVPPRGSFAAEPSGIELPGLSCVWFGIGTRGEKGRWRNGGGVRGRRGRKVSNCSRRGRWAGKAKKRARMASSRVAGPLVQLGKGPQGGRCSLTRGQRDGHPMQGSGQCSDKPVRPSDRKSTIGWYRRSEDVLCGNWKQRHLWEDIMYHVCNLCSTIFILMLLLSERYFIKRYNSSCS